MNKPQTDFLLKYAKIGILAEKDKVDDIQYDEIKEEYLNIKKELLVPKEDTPVKSEQKNTGEKKKGAVSKWFGGIGDRQRKYQEAHKEDIV